MPMVWLLIAAIVIGAAIAFISEVEKIDY